MDSRIRGITVTLCEVTETGVDGFGEPILEEREVDVDNVLVAPSTSDDIIDATNLYGKKAVYTLAIPKGDTHEWEDRTVRFFGRDWHCFAIVTEGIEENIPLSWNRKVMVESYG